MKASRKAKVEKVTAAYRLPAWLARQVVIEAAHRGEKPYQLVERVLAKSVAKGRSLQEPAAAG